MKLYEKTICGVRIELVPGLDRVLMSPETCALIEAQTLFTPGTVQSWYEHDEFTTETNPIIEEEK